MNIKIQKIEEQYINGFYQALCNVASEGVYMLTTNPPPYEKMVNFVRNNIKHNFAQYVALADNRVVGWIDIIPLERNTMNHVGHLGMGILAEFRSKGIGSRLLEKAMSHAWHDNLTRLELEVFSDNNVAIKLYEKYNFKHEGVKRQARLFEEKYQDITIMGQCNH